MQREPRKSSSRWAKAPKAGGPTPVGVADDEEEESWEMPDWMALQVTGRPCHHHHGRAPPSSATIL